jgi:hypothetical protein
MPLSPKKCCGKNVKFTPKNIKENCDFSFLGFRVVPVIKGNQWVMPAIIVNTAPIERT